MLKSVIYDKMAAHPQIHAEVLPNESISPHNSYEVHPSSSKKKTKLSSGRKSLFLLLKNRKNVIIVMTAKSAFECKLRSILNVFAVEVPLYSRHV